MDEIVMELNLDETTVFLIIINNIIISYHGLVGEKRAGKLDFDLNILISITANMAQLYTGKK